MHVGVAAAKDKLTQLLRAVEQGERVTICRRGKAIVDLVPRQVDVRKTRVFGANRGIKILDPDWAKPQDDVEAWLRGDV